MIRDKQVFENHRYRELPLIIFLLLFGIPPIFIGIGASSYASGMIFFDLLFLIWLLPNISRKLDLSYKKKYLGFLLILLFSFIFLHTFYIIMYDSTFDIKKFYITYAGLILTFLSAWAFGNIIIRQPEKRLNRNVTILILFFMLNVCVSFFGLNLTDGWSPVGLFSEPSHLAVFLAPLLIYSSIKKMKWNIAFLFFFFLWGIIKLNMTIELIVLFSSLFYITKFKKVIWALLIFLFIGSISISFIDISYFTSRFNLSSDTTNASALVFLKGWENAIESLDKTDFIGIGYQQLGYSKLISPGGNAYHQLIAMDYGELNKYDGGSTSPKLIAEFGLLGILVIFLYLFVFFKMIKTLKFQEKKAGVLFLQCCYFGLLFELFIRGVGYFSIGTFLFIASITNLRLMRTNHQYNG
jgi:hypothetical protein